MSSDNEAQSSADKAIPADGSLKIIETSKIRYTRDFLLSLSELECCKNLPNEFDKSLLSEFEDTSLGIHDRFRTISSLPTHGFRRTEYGSSPPTRGDSGNYSRPSYGRWDSRSSGRSDRDSDSQSDRESDSGRRFGNQPRKSWQGTEHDGLLGSGSFPRPSGHSAGTSGSKVRSNDQSHLNRSNEPYHPPRPYKAAPLSRRDTDSYNDETFGSTDSTNEGRVEEERRRRASFELMRKEQTKALQEKQKPNAAKHNADSILDVLLMPDDPKGEKMVLNQGNELDVISNPCNIDPGKSASHSQAPYRPLVPPGFRSTVVDKTSGMKSLFPQGHSVENGSHSGLEGKTPGELNLNNEAEKNTHISSKDENSAYTSLHSDVSSKIIVMDDLPLKNSIQPEACEALNEPDFVKVSGLKIGGEPKENNSTSILDKIFANTAASVDVSTDAVENHVNKPEDSWSLKTVPSSKFARWFIEEERKTEDERSSNDLLSLIVGNDKGRNQVDIKPVLQFQPPEFPGQGSEVTQIVNLPIPNASHTTSGIPESCSNGKNQEVPAVLTCEDLEQTILSEYGDKSPKSEPQLDGWSISGAKPELPRAHVDSDASQHLLSLLQKGASIIETAPKITPNVSSELPSTSHVFEGLPATYNAGQDIKKDINTPGESLTLETLFGSAFMKELKSVEAPVSAQRGSVGSYQAESSEPDSGIFLSNLDQTAIEKITNEQNILGSNQMEQKVGKTEKWLGYDDPQIELNLSNHQAGVLPKHGGFGRPAEYRLPEEESLIADEDINAQFSRLILGKSLSRRGSLVSNGPDDIADKLSYMAAAKDERATGGSDGPPFLPGSYNQIEREMAYHDLHAHSSSSHIHPMQISHGRQVVHPLDSHPSHMNSQMKFVGRESVIQHEALTTQQFPGNVDRPPFPQPNVGVSGFGHPAHHQILPHMPMPGSYPQQLVNDFPRGAPIPHRGNQTANFMPEINSMQGHPFGSHHPQVRGVGMPLPGPAIHGGNNHPDAFQRLVEMEMRAKSKQQIPSPFAGGHHAQAMYGHELDMGFRFR